MAGIKRTIVFIIDVDEARVVRDSLLDYKKNAVLSEDEIDIVEKLALKAAVEIRKARE